MAFEFVTLLLFAQFSLIYVDFFVWFTQQNNIKLVLINVFIACTYKSIIYSIAINLIKYKVPIRWVILFFLVHAFFKNIFTNRVRK